MIAAKPVRVNPDADGFRMEPSDPRIVAFARLCGAIDTRDHSAGIAATRELRQLGLSVCVIKAYPKGGGR